MGALPAFSVGPPPMYTPGLVPETQPIGFSAKNVLRVEFLVGFGEKIPPHVKSRIRGQP